MSWSFIDICAGIGGFHAAAAELGGKCVGAWEKDEQAARVYEDNWGIDPRGDVTTESWEGLPRVDVVFAGFPCQPFSKSGAQKGIDEARGTIFFDVCRAIEKLQPSVVCLENVRNLTGPKHTDTWATIIRTLRELGYRVSSTPVILSPHWIDPLEGGTPQNRERVYILATRVGAEAAAEEVLPTIQLSKWAGTWELETDLPLQGEELKSTPEFEHLAASAEELKWMSAWGDLVDQLRSLGEELPRFPIWVDSWFGSIPGAPAWKRSIELKNQTWFRKERGILEHWAATSGLSSFPASRRKMEWQAQDAEHLEDCLVQLRPSGLRVKKATHTGALVAIDQRPFLVKEGRRLSTRECARLQGFPEWFSFDAAPRWAYKQLGNAVHVGSVKYALRHHVLAPETVAALGHTNPVVDALLGAEYAAYAEDTAEWARLTEGAAPPPPPW